MTPAAMSETSEPVRPSSEEGNCPVVEVEPADAPEDVSAPAPPAGGESAQKKQRQGRKKSWIHGLITQTDQHLVCAVKVP